MTGRFWVDCSFQKKLLEDEIAEAVGCLKEPALLELKSKLNALDLAYLQKIAREIQGVTPNEALDVIVEEVNFCGI